MNGIFGEKKPCSFCVDFLCCALTPRPGQFLVHLLHECAPQHQGQAAAHLGHLARHPAAEGGPAPQGQRGSGEVAGADVLAEVAPPSGVAALLVHVAVVPAEVLLDDGAWRGKRKESILHKYL